MLPFLPPLTAAILIQLQLVNFYHLFLSYVMSQQIPLDFLFPLHDKLMPHHNNAKLTYVKFHMSQIVKLILDRIRDL